MKSTISVWDRFWHFMSALAMIIVGYFIFENIIAQVFAYIIALWALIEGIVGRCMIYERLGIEKGSKRLSGDSIFLMGLAWIQYVFAYRWFTSGWEKFRGDFGVGFADSLTALGRDNPWPFLETLLEWVSFSGDGLAQLVIWGEMMTGVFLALFTTLLLFVRTIRAQNWALLFNIAVLGVSATMSFLFYFAGGHLSPSTQDINIVMFWGAIGLLFAWISSVYHKPQWPTH